MIVYDKMVVYGGWSENGDRNLWQADSVIRILNLKTLTWELRDAPKSGAGSEKPPPRAGHGAIMVGIRRIVAATIH